MVVSESWVQSERAKVHNELNRKIARDLLRRTSSRLIEAPDGEAGVTAALEQRPDLASTYLAKPYSPFTRLSMIRTLPET